MSENSVSDVDCIRTTARWCGPQRAMGSSYTLVTLIYAIVQLVGCAIAYFQLVDFEPPGHSICDYDVDCLHGRPFLSKAHQNETLIGAMTVCYVAFALFQVGGLLTQCIERREYDDLAVEAAKNTDGGHCTTIAQCLPVWVKVDQGRVKKSISFPWFTPTWCGGGCYVAGFAFLAANMVLKGIVWRSLHTGTYELPGGRVDINNCPSSEDDPLYHYCRDVAVYSHDQFGTVGDWAGGTGIVDLLAPGCLLLPAAALVYDWFRIRARLNRHKEYSTIYNE